MQENNINTMSDLSNINEKKIELLAPAKDLKTAVSAINAGADAVYIGYSKFGARKQAGNSLDDIKKVIDYAHKFLCKVYVTLNTIYTDCELEEVINVINELYKVHVDAILIQDMGILNSKLPNVKLHASTQCNNNSIEKIQFLEKIGLKRVVLPREIPVEEIRNISKNSDIELEAFIHGALCVSYSGQCYLSYANGGRSANRGECAQPCRKKYTLVDSNNNILVKDKYLLSLKDLNLSEYIEKMIDAGIISFKIEGRLKDENYVKNVVAYYRKIIDQVLTKKNLQKSSIGRTNYEFLPVIEKTFNRGMTDFNIDSKRKNICTFDYVKSIGEKIGKISSVNKNYFTIDKGELHKNDGICFFDKNNDLRGTKIEKTENGKYYPTSVENIYKGKTIFRNLDYDYNQKLQKEDFVRKIDANLKITLNKKFLKVKIIDESGLCEEKIFEGDFETANKPDIAKQNVKKQFLKTGETEYKINNIEIDGEDIFIPINEINEMRRVLINSFSKKREKIYNKELECENNLINNACNIKYPIKELDYSFNVLNDSAEEFYKKHGSKVTERALETGYKADNKTVMTSKHCIKYTMGLCKKYPNNQHCLNEKDIMYPLFLIDEKDKKIKLEFDCKNCNMKLIY